jgi:hypothetical protein
MDSRKPDSRTVKVVHSIMDSMGAKDAQHMVAPLLVEFLHGTSCAPPPLPRTMWPSLTPSLTPSLLSPCAALQSTRETYSRRRSACERFERRQTPAER